MLLVKNEEFLRPYLVLQLFHGQYALLKITLFLLLMMRQMAYVYFNILKYTYQNYSIYLPSPLPTITFACRKAFPLRM